MEKPEMLLLHSLISLPQLYSYGVCISIGNPYHRVGVYVPSSRGLHSKGLLTHTIQSRRSSHTLFVLPVFAVQQRRTQRRLVPRRSLRAPKAFSSLPLALKSSWLGCNETQKGPTWNIGRSMPSGSTWVSSRRDLFAIEHTRRKY